jgi:hypothetical protein
MIAFFSETADILYSRFSSDLTIDRGSKYPVAKLVCFVCLIARVCKL